MNTITLSKQKRRPRIVLTVSPRKYDFLIELLRNLDFVKVEQDKDDGDSREEILDNLKQAAKDIKLIKAGKLEGRPARELLKEL